MVPDWTELMDNSSKVLNKITLLPRSSTNNIAVGNLVIKLLQENSKSTAKQYNYKLNFYLVDDQYTLTIKIPSYFF